MELHYFQVVCEWESMFHQGIQRQEAVQNSTKQGFLKDEIQGVAGLDKTPKTSSCRFDRCS